MKTIAIILAAAAVMASASTEILSFDDYLSNFGKTYSGDEKGHRAAIYAQNVAKMMKHNSEGHSWTMGINRFADLTPEEFSALYLGLKAPSKALRGQRQAANQKRTVPHYQGSLPDTFDWSTHPGIVSPIKNQAQCGSCWAFSTIETVESAVALAGGGLTELSPQQLVACSSAYGNMGCNGGLQQQGYKYIIQNGGVATEKCYPYTAGQGNTGKCKLKSNDCSQDNGQIHNFTWVFPNHNETVLQEAIMIEPVSISVNAASGWQMYSGGVMAYNDCSGGLDHAVVVQGWGTRDNKEYWVVRNSWAADWGEKGFIWLERGKKTLPHGTSCLLDGPLYPIVKGDVRDDDSTSVDDPGDEGDDY